jgi:hypothetical protein
MIKHKKLKMTSFMIDENKLDELKIIAQKRETSSGSIIRLAINEYLRKYK